MTIGFAELKEQLVVEEVDGEGQEGKVKEEGRGRVKENAPWVWPWMTVNRLRTWAMRCAVSSSSVEQCALCASSMHDVHHAIVEVNVVIDILVVHCELLVVRVVPVVVLWWCSSSSHTCSHSFHRSLCFRRGHFHRILLYWRYCVYTSRRWQWTAVGCYWILNCNSAPSEFWESYLE